MREVRRQLARFTQEPVFARRLGSSGEYCLTFRDRAELRPDLHLVLRHYLAIEGNEVNGTGYHYALENSARAQILVYHWHPDRGAVDWPHLHIGSGAGLARRALVGVHIPTGGITWSQVLLLLAELAQ